jgi:ABC-type amino acid transport/signal transduction systems, periplasmic component/domain
MVTKVRTKTSLQFKGYARFTCEFLAFFTLLFAFAPLLAWAQASAPAYTDPRERIVARDLSSRSRIRFLTTVDFPPFNFIDQSGRLAGFHVDLARAMCDVLKMRDKCQIQALPWDELEGALETSQGEALIAGVAMTEETRRRYRFTRPYLELPARFVVRGDSTFEGRAATALAGRRVGVAARSAHEAMLRAWFPGVSAVPIERQDWLFEALRQGRVDAVFGDGVQLSFWLSSSAAEGCCRLFDGPYISRDFLGEGLAIAVAPRNEELTQAFDAAIAELNRNGRFAELYLRWFPNGLY